ncbi:MFS transporter [Phenylobacterium sp.]|uniref:MFS transporter n=1 Tax=Phenylobacterium sp. TaxID=1871053 RepID=UPI002F41E918
MAESVVPAQEALASKDVQAERRRWWLLGLVITAGILNLVDRQLISVLKPLIEVDMGWSDADYGKLASLFQLSAALAYIGVGWIVDRLGVKWATPAGVAAWSLAAMVHGWAMTMGQFSAARIALGATESMGTPAFVKTLGSVFSARTRSLAFGVSNGASSIGAIAAPLVLPLLAVSVGWRGSFILVGALGFVWVALWIGVTRGVAFARPAPTEASPGTLGGLKVLLADRRTWGIAGAKVLSDQVWWLLLFWAPDFFHRVFGISAAHLGPPLAVAYLGSALGSVAAGWAASRLLARGVSVNATRKGVMLVCALMVTTVPLALYTHNLWIAAGLLAVTLGGHQGFSISIFSTIADITPRSRIGSVTAFGALCGNLAGMGIVFLAGQILTAGLGYAPLLAIASVSYLLGLAWLHAWVPKLQPLPEVELVSL